jgi:hypothetical protein
MGSFGKYKYNNEKYIILFLFLKEDNIKKYVKKITHKNKMKKFPSGFEPITFCA